MSSGGPQQRLHPRGKGATPHLKMARMFGTRTPKNIDSPFFVGFAGNAAATVARPSKAPGVSLRPQRVSTRLPGRAAEPAVCE